jgi:hypothetical protein
VAFVNEDGTVDAYWRTEDSDDHLTYESAELDLAFTHRAGRQDVLGRAAVFVNKLRTTLFG